jgi:signal transduction histidine kinase
VNNFAGVSAELLDELREALGPTMGGLKAEACAEVEALITTLNNNLSKIAEHGRRADGIVKSMLLHSRGGSGERQNVDINSLIEEALNLAYHGARAQDKEFNITIERDLDPHFGPIELVPQDITRVFLNLFGNGFYAANQRPARRQGQRGLSSCPAGDDARPRGIRLRRASATTVWVFQRTCRQRCSRHSYPPSLPAKAPALASR